MMLRTGRAVVLQGDARTLPLADGSIDAIVCDPPYELGFMGRRWDRTGVAYDVNTWREAYRVLKPGGHLLAFGGSRTWHRLCCAIEDAGFEVRDSISWMYASGFPKSLDVSKAIDAAAGAERDVVGHSDSDRRKQSSWNPDSKASGVFRANDDGFDVTTPATDAPRRWQGWGTALKPAFEPIVVARKPLAGTVASNVLAHGTGAINIDACRLEMSDDDREEYQRGAVAWREMSERRGDGTVRAANIYGTYGITEANLNDGGRWPPNVVLSHVPLLDADGQPVGDACEAGCVPGCPVADLDAQSGFSVTPSTVTRGGSRAMAFGMARQDNVTCYGDEGGASRFFPCFRYEPKAPTEERPVVNGVAHPTVKPLDLMRWLVRLVTPPAGLVLDPFAGSGTTVEAALLERFDVCGVEKDPDHIPLIQFRVDRARRRMQPGISRLKKAKPAPTGAVGLFDDLDELEEIA